ncbi:MAG: 6-hydroxymethylpterin diphosphokinase MptE-like protein [Candidatus Altarchaeaceae archaeon]
MITYSEISKILNLNEEKDRKAAEILRNIVSHNQEIDINIAVEKIKNKIVIIFGAGPSLKNDLLKLKNFINDKICKISADGATTCLIENKIYPDFIFTDLDGNVEKIIESNEKKSIVVLHAHGDNIENLKIYAKKFKNLILTTQVPNANLKGIYNFGGFTDGDRALFFALNFNSKIVILAGMDFGNIVGEYSKKVSGDRLKFKLKKLEIGKRLIEERCKNLNNVYDFTENGNLNLRKIDVKEIEKILKF